MIQLKDVIHLYMGCDLSRGGQMTAHMYLYGNLEQIESGVNKPLLRPLSDMSEEEAFDAFNIGRGLHSDNKVDEIKRMSTSEFYLRTGIGEHLFGWSFGYDNDVRVSPGYSFYIKRFCIKEELSVSEEGIKRTPSHFNPINNEDKFNSCLNQSQIFVFLLSRSFDLFGLIESGQAIDKTKSTH